MRIGSMLLLNPFSDGLGCAFFVVSNPMSADVGLADGLNNAFATHLGVLTAGPGLVVPEDMLTLRTSVGVPMCYEVADVDAESAKSGWRSSVDWLRCWYRLLEAYLGISNRPLGPRRGSYLR